MSHIYMSRGVDETPGLETRGISILLVEVCEEGFVTREVGLDDGARVVHRAPSPKCPTCLAGSGRIPAAERRRDLSRAEFEYLWTDSV